MSEHDRCETCRFGQGGRCHRYPPKFGLMLGIIVNGFGIQSHQFPEVKKSDWCGEYQGAHHGQD